MNRNDVKRILMSMRNVENENQVNYLLGKIDLLSEEKLQLMIDEIGNNEEIMREYFKKKITEIDNNKPNRPIDYYSNSDIDERESRTFSQVKQALEKILKILEEKQLTIYISGGTVPYLLLNEESNRLHDDIDTICKLEDVEKLRQLFKEEGLYIPEWDSKNHAQDGKDYGFEMKIGGVPFGIYPFEYADGTITQYSFDPYNKTCKTKTIPIEQLSDYVNTYESTDGKIYNTMSLEYIKLTKNQTRRPKDLVDSQKISEYGIRNDVMSRIYMYTEVQSQRFEEELRD